MDALAIPALRLIYAPMDTTFAFDNSFARLGDGFFTAQAPVPVKAPHLLAFNDELARMLQITPGDVAELAQIFGGNLVPDGADPLAQLYSGHQFGNYNLQLGDGRAVLLGEVIGQDGVRRDIQLKGSGRTPYSRGGDGRAWLGPVLREYVVGEAMAALGIPTTRALAVVTTGEDVIREGRLPGAVLTRVAASHLRVGTFQIFAARGQHEHLQKLTDYAIARHYPDASGPMGLLTAVRDAQADLIAGWMAVGFIHGVMNTDNCAISGETIDYGPCAFLDEYHPDTVFSSIDQQGRYSYANQPNIVVWNLAQLAMALIPLEKDRDAAVEQATEIVHAMPALIEAARLDRFRAKLGLVRPHKNDGALIDDLLACMAEGRADFANTFRTLGTAQARDQFADPQAFDSWAPQWGERRAGQPDGAAIMRAANPAIIPRNHQIEAMIDAALTGELAPFHRLNTALATPFEDQPDMRDLQRPPQPDQVVQATFCGT